MTGWGCRYIETSIRGSFESCAEPPKAQRRELNLSISRSRKLQSADGWRYLVPPLRRKALNRGPGGLAGRPDPGASTVRQDHPCPNGLSLREPAGGRRPSGIFPDRLEDYTYFSFDDEVARAGAEADPLGFVAELPDRVILDEAQRAPALFAQILQALIELDEAGSEERSILEALSNHVKTRDHVIPTRRGRFALD